MRTGVSRIIRRSWPFVGMFVALLAGFAIGLGSESSEVESLRAEVDLLQVELTRVRTERLAGRTPTAARTTTPTPEPEPTEPPISIRIGGAPERIIAKTGGVGVSHRDACDDDARTGEPALADGLLVTLAERGVGECSGWLVVRIEGGTAWVRAEYLVTPAPTPTPTPTPLPLTASLILEPGWGCRRTGGGSFFEFEGQVTNNTSRSMENVVAVVTYTDSDGGFVTSDDALIDFDPILARQTSPFSVLTRANPAIAKCSVQFKEFFGGTIRHQLRR